MLRIFVRFLKSFIRGLGPFIVASIFIGAVYLLYREISKYSLTELYMSVERIPNKSLLFSGALAIFNYIVLIGYDWLALKGISKTLPLSKVSFVSFIGQAVSYNFGALLGGSTVRYRFYTSWGFSYMDMVKLILMLAITFWVGALGLAGAIFLFAPPEIPPDLIKYFPMRDIRPLGAILLFIAAAYLIACKLVHKSIRVGGKEFSFPPFHIAVAQALVASADLIVAGGCLYVLLPEGANISFFQFLPMYLMAMVAVVLTHVPGGAGVLEVTILHLTSVSPQDVIAALLCFRVIYYLIPLLVAAVLFVVYEIRKQTEENAHFWKKAFQYLRVYSPIVLYGCAFIMGSVFVFVAMFPMSIDKLEVLYKFVSHWVIDISSVVVGVSGVFLLFLSIGLKNRKQKAFYLSLLFIFAGCVGILVSTLRLFVSAVFACVGLSFLSVRSCFYRKSSLWEARFPAGWFTTALSVLVCAAGLGLSVRHIDIGKIVWTVSEHAHSGHRVALVILSEAFVLLLLILRYIQIGSMKMIKKKHSKSR